MRETSTELVEQAGRQALLGPRLPPAGGLKSEAFWAAKDSGALQRGATPTPVRSLKACSLLRSGGGG